MSFPKFVNMTKNIHFFPILHVFAPLNDVRAYIAWSWKTTLITWFFYEDDIQLQIQVPPPPPVQYDRACTEVEHNHKWWSIMKPVHLTIWCRCLIKEEYSPIDCEITAIYSKLNLFDENKIHDD